MSREDRGVGAPRKRPRGRSGQESRARPSCLRPQPWATHCRPCSSGSAPTPRGLGLGPPVPLVPGSLVLRGLSGRLGTFLFLFFIFFLFLLVATFLLLLCKHNLLLVGGRGPFSGSPGVRRGRNSSSWKVKKAGDREVSDPPTVRDFRGPHPQAPPPQAPPPQAPPRS